MSDGEGAEPKREEPKPGPTTFGEQPTLDERIAELRELGKNNKEMVRILYSEGYNTHEMMKRHLPLIALKTFKKKDKEEPEAVMGAIAGTTKGPGYLDELKVMIQHEIQRTRELTDVFNNVGLGVLLASLRKSGIEIEDFRKIALRREGLRGALEKAGETAFKALEYYESDLVTRVEAERDEARAYSTQLEFQVKGLVKELDPKLRLEKMIYTYLLSGASDPETLITLIDKWLELELHEVKMGMISA